MENIENNKLIAEFMGILSGFKKYTSNPDDTGILIYEFPHSEGKVINITPEEMRFHSDWNWLMPVVEKIDNINVEIDGVINSFRFIISDKGAEIQRSEFPCGMQPEWISTYEKDSLILGVYNACVEFIKWYNQQKH